MSYLVSSSSSSIVLAKYLQWEHDSCSQLLFIDNIYAPFALNLDM